MGCTAVVRGEMRSHSPAAAVGMGMHWGGDVLGWGCTGVVRAVVSYSGQW